ncbi:MAG TPA: transglycosylase domain-containing protein [Nitrospirota bacterium]|jgi:monofunctional biosynthetic peptidoglycan transglycosylase
MKRLFFSFLAVLAVSVLGVSAWFFSALRDLPDVAALKRYRPAAAAEVLDKDGDVLTHYYDRKFRIWTPVSAVADIAIRAVVISEDDTFFAHQGVNYKATWDALVHDVQKRRFARGGSTITQQMIKNVFLSKEKTVTRKLREYVLAGRAEEILSKRRILEIYLNEVEWGENVYGIEAASRFYFDKHVSELTAGEAALLAGMLPNPRYYNPFKRMQKARRRQEQVLFNMHQARVLTAEEYTEALAAPINLRPEEGARFDLSALSGPDGRACWQRALEGTLVKLYGEHAVYRSGMTIRTTLDKALQYELNLWEGGREEKPARRPENIIAVRQGDVIRAIVCAQGGEEEVQSYLEYRGLSDWYNTVEIPTVSISREQIIFPSRNGVTQEGR